jgi:LacI family transcriptional regulator
MSAPVTIRDIARLAGVTPGTVSRALNPQTQGMLNDETVTRVRTIADAIGYRPNTLAQGLKTSRSYTVGVLIPDLTNPLFPPIVRGIDDRLTAAGYTSLIVSTDNDPERGRAGVDAMLIRRVDGLIAATARLDLEPLLDAAWRGVPLVLVNRRLADDSIAAVTVDDAEGSRLAVQHVLGLGHERIAYIGGPQNASTGHRRYLGFVAAMAAVGCPPQLNRVGFAQAFTEAEGARLAVAILGQDPTVTALIAANDRLAIGCYDALAGRGLVCPDDVSVVGFNDIPMVDRLSPGLTTVRVPQREIGYACADLLLRQIAGDAGAPGNLLLEPALVVRGSTAPPVRHDV